MHFCSLSQTFVCYCSLFKIDVVYCFRSYVFDKLPRNFLSFCYIKSFSFTITSKASILFGTKKKDVFYYFIISHFPRHSFILNYA